MAITERISRPWPSRGRHALAQNELTVLADRGYFRGEKILECDQAGGLHSARALGMQYKCSDI